MNAYELYVKIGADLDGLQSGLGKAASMSKSVIGGIGKVAKVGFGAVTAAVGAGTAAVGAFGKGALDAYASFEQLEGGVKKLYGESEKAYQTMMNNAAEAYKTAGMSTNDYMETATSFSAALINSLGGDLDTAANMTDVAMRAMSDNANTFGTDIESIKNAFQGFAKGNMTMLDNLKLGYGGTKEEMERLLRDAEQYEGYIEGSLDINNFADIIDAIQIVQEHLNVAGTTAKEAMTTIEGSANATKGAWENLKTAIGRGEGISEAFSGLKESIFGVGMIDGKETGLINQIIPRIKTIMSGVGQFIQESAPLISENIPPLVDAILPTIVDGGVKLAESVGAILPELFNTALNIGGQVFEAATGIMQKIAEGMESFDFATATQNVISFISQSLQSGSMGDFLTAGLTIAENLVRGIVESAPVLWDAGIELIHNLTEGVQKHISDIIPTAMYMLMEFSGTIREKAGQLVDAGLGLIKAIAEGIINNLPVFIKTIPTIVTNIAGIINDNAPKLLATGIELIGKLIAGIVQSIPTLIAEFPKIVQAIFAVITAVNWVNLGGNIITGIKNGVTKLANSLPNTLKNIGEKAVSFFKGIQWGNLGSSVINMIVTGIKSLVSLIPTALKTIGTTAVALFKSINWLELGVNVIAAICSGLISAGGMIKDALINAAKDAWNSVVDFFKGKGGEKGGEKGGSGGTLESAFAPTRVIDTNMTNTGLFADDGTAFNYTALANAIVKAFVASDIKIECDDREFGRLVRKAVMT